MMRPLEIEFYDALRESIAYTPELYENPSSKRLYYKSEYENNLKEKIEKRSPGTDLKRINKGVRAVASSARLAVLDFVNCENAIFEKALWNDLLGRRGPTFFDVAIDNCFYECKCQEIIGANKPMLRVRYKTESKLFAELIGQSELKNCEEITNRKGDVYISFPLQALDISLDKDYNALHFDLKQLICHIIAIAHSCNSNAILQYVIYKPQESSIDKRPLLKDMYLELEREINAIWDKKNKISRFCDNKGITLALPEFKSINGIDDFAVH